MIYFIVHGFLIHIHGYFCYAWFYSFIFMVHFHGTKESGIWMHHFTFIPARRKAFYVLAIPDNAFWPGDSCLDQPCFHLKFANEVMSSIMSTISRNSALSNQWLSWHSRMSFALHQSGHRFGLPPGTFSCL